MVNCIGVCLLWSAVHAAVPALSFGGGAPLIAACAMAVAAEQSLNEFVRGGPLRSLDVTVTLEHDFFEMLCRRNKKPSTTSVKRWWGMLKRPLDDTNVYCTLNLTRRALLDWPKMGAAIAKMAEAAAQEVCCEGGDEAEEAGHSRGQAAQHGG